MVRHRSDMKTEPHRSGNGLDQIHEVLGAGYRRRCNVPDAGAEGLQLRRVRKIEAPSQDVSRYLSARKRSAKGSIVQNEGYCLRKANDPAAQRQRACIGVVGDPRGEVHHRDETPFAILPQLTAPSDFVPQHVRARIDRRSHEWTLTGHSQLGLEARAPAVAWIVKDKCCGGGFHLGLSTVCKEYHASRTGIYA